LRARSSFALLAVALVACTPEPRRVASGPRRELSWHLDLHIDAPGGDAPAMLADPGGGLWVAVTGIADASGRSRLFHRPPGGAWRTVYEGPFATEPSLSSIQPGEVYFGSNRPLDRFRPTLLRVSEGGVEPMPAPAERLDELEMLQIGGYAMRSPRDGFACGQRGSLFRWDGERWAREPDVLPWKPGDPAARSFCQSIAILRNDRGFLVDASGASAAWDGQKWQRIQALDGFRGAAPASGLARDGGALARWDGAWRRLTGEIDAGAVLDARGAWALSESGASSIGEREIRRVRGALPTSPRAVAEADGDLWALGAEGVFRSSRRGGPTFASAPPGGPAPGLLYAIAVDLDQDGDEDLLGLRAPRGAVFGARAALTVAINDGRGRFTEASLGLPDDVYLWRDRFDVGDVDGDGDLDVVTVSAGGRVDLFRAEGGRFERAWSREIAGATVALVDVDGDGDLDLSLIPARPSILTNDGAGRFDEAVTIPLPEAPVERALWADVDGDGDADAVLQHWRDPAELLRNTGRGFELVPLGVVAEGATIADVDRDGVPEILAQKIHVRGVALPFARCRVATAGCAPVAGEAMPAGVVIDLDLDGQEDVIASDLRGDEAMAGDGEVWRGSARGAGFERITEITGAMPRPVPIDADGDGDPDVYVPESGLRANTTDAPTFLRVRPRASRSDRRAKGALAIARRAGGGPIVASGRALFGVVTLGLPDEGARYDVEVRFPGGDRRVVRDLAAGTEITVRDRETPAYLARLAALWARGTWIRIDPPRDLAIAAAMLVAWASWRRRTPRASRLRLALPLFAASWLALAGPVVRARGATRWLLAPGAALVAAAGQGLAILRARRASARAAGPYVLEAKLGSGAAATVWRARAGKSRVALKLFSAESMGSREARERFFREARVGSEIKHPNVVRIRDAGELDDGRCYLAMELVEGRSLADVIRDEGKLAPGAVASIGADVARALAALHEAEIVHRDVKPENILVRPDGSAVLTDLGLAQSALFRTLTRHDVAVGTLAYMSPEQCVGRPLDGRSDLWSLGVTLYEALTGRRAFDAKHELELVYVIHNVDPERPSAIVPDAPLALEAAILRCLDREPEARFASAGELVAALTAEATAVRGGLVSGTIETRPSAKRA
jgi:tRNA A-37 threonylcarbamoyl transferase component Bud32